MVERGGAQPDEHLARPGLGVGDVLVAQHLRAAVLVDPNRLHAGTISALHDRRRRARAAGRGARARRRRGGARPRRTRRPSGTSASAARAASSPTCASRWRSRRSRATRRRCSPAPAPSSRPRSATTRPAPDAGAGRGAAAALHVVRRATRSCARSSTRSARRLGGAYRVLVDANQHVDREGAARAGVGFYGKNTMLITRRHGSWVVLGTLVTDVELEPTPPLEPTAAPARSASTPARPTRSTSRASLDATRCLSYWTQAPAPIPEEYREELGDRGLRLRHLPGRLSLEPRRREAARRPGAARRAPSRTSRSSTGSSRTTRSSRRATTGSTSRATTRATCAGTRSSRSGTSGGRAARLAVPYAEGDDPLLREHADVGARPARSARVKLHCEPQRRTRARTLDRLDPPRRGRRSRSPRSRSAAPTPPGYERWAWVDDGAVRSRRGRLLLALAGSHGARRSQLVLALTALAFDFAVVSALRPRSSPSSATGAGPPARCSSPLIEAAVRFGILGGDRRDRRERPACSRSSSGCAPSQFDAAATATTTSRSRSGSSC